MLKKISLFLLLCLLCVSPVLANSAQTYWEGENHTGVIQSGEESPLIVQEEELIFTINEFPSNYYSNVEDAKAYSGKVEAKYTFHNPSDMNIKVRLLFPYGNLPGYTKVYDLETNEEYKYYNDDKYSITLNGKAIKKKIRYSAKMFNNTFHLEEDLDKISDTYIERDIFRVDTPVKKYVFKTHTAASNYRLGYKIDWNAVQKENLPYVVYGSNVISDKKDLYVLVGSEWLEKEDEFEIYYIGTEYEIPEWKIYTDEKFENEVKGEVELIEEETLTFKDFVMERHMDKNINEIDWYNIFVNYLEIYDYVQLNIIDLSLPNYYDYLRWYDYTIEVGPNETVVNTVCAPLYPGINTNYEPTIYEYTYLLTPASTFKEFNDLTIHINTPYYLNTCNLEGFEKKEDGYVLKLDTLPEKDLEFVLSENEVLYEKPKPARDYVYPIYFMLMVFGPFVLLGGLVIAVLYFSKSKQ